MKYSIILPYNKRYDQFKNTLISFVHHYQNRNDFEIIIGEDYKNSIDESEHYKLISLIENFSSKLNLRIEKTYFPGVYNPCLSFNHCASVASGEFLIISNPECFHETNILNGLDTETENNKNVYVVCSCRTIDNLKIKNNKLIYIIDPTMKNYCDGWLQHSIYNNRMFHFCVCLSKENFINMGGFDPNFQYGIAWEDVDFINRVKISKMDIKLRDDLKVLHQYHSKEYQLNDLIKINMEYHKTKWK